MVEGRKYHLQLIQENEQPCTHGQPEALRFPASVFRFPESFVEGSFE